MYLTPKKIKSNLNPYLTVEKDHNINDQKWIIEKTGEIGIYTIKNLQSNQHLDVAGNSLDSNVKIIQSPQNNQVNQKIEICGYWKWHL